MAQLNCAIPEDLHVDAKMIAVAQGVPLKAIVVESLAAYVADHPPSMMLNQPRRQTKERE